MAADDSLRKEMSSLHDVSFFSCVSWSYLFDMTHAEVLMQFWRSTRLFRCPLDLSGVHRTSLRGLPDHQWSGHKHVVCTSI